MHQMFMGSRDDIMNHLHYGSTCNSAIHSWSATSACSVEYLSTSSISAVPGLESVNVPSSYLVSGCRNSTFIMTSNEMDLYYTSVLS